MRLVLRLKVDQNPEVKRILLATKNDEIVEDCTKRNPWFWEVLGHGPGGYRVAW